MKVVQVSFKQPYLYISFWLLIISRDIPSFIPIIF